MKFFLSLLCALLVSCATAHDASTPGYLGFSFAYYPPEEGNDVGWLLVQHIHPDGPAEATGLTPQTVITAINGRALDFTEDLDLLHLLSTIRPRDRVRLTLGGQHQGKQLTLVAAEMPPEALRRWKANFERH